MKKTLTIFFLVTLTLTSCDQIRKKSQKKEKLEVTDFKDVKINNLYKIKVPKYMKEMKSLHEEASFKYANIFKETYTIVIDESKQEFIDVFVEYDLYDKEKSTLDNYEEMQLSNFKETIENIEIIPLGDLLINGNSAKQYTLKGKVEAINVEYLITFLEGKKNMFMLMSWTIDSRMKKYFDSFKEAHTSFRLI
ncbi:hypothetical protein [Tenacibaculum singaporense]|uniref:hypothetical protein n=1 Tax=Tenacibaculum singaporense TaxID=2358479 RepID=UPI000F678BFB|nr:hypothetical protein [Tenacibaculum singaporense]RSC93013.1 hypothetical protein EI424_11275 [Tenacibaculum singaporense]